MKNSAPKIDKTIAIKCKAAGCIPWRLIKPLQGSYKKRNAEDIEKLSNLIIKRGIRFPSHISKIGQDIWAIDTHGRLQAYEKLESEGWVIPDIPVNYIDAKNKAEAKQLLLECDSRYGHVTHDGYEEYTHDFDVEEDYLSIAFQDIDVSDIDLENAEDTGMKKVNLKPYEKIHVLISFHPDKFAEIQSQLEAVKNTAGVEYEQSAN